MKQKLGRVVVALSLLAQPAAAFAVELTGPLGLNLPEIRAVVPTGPAAMPATLAPLVNGSLTLPGTVLAPLAGAEGATAQTAQAAESARTAQATLSQTVKAIAGEHHAESAAQGGGDRPAGFVASQEVFDGQRPQRATALSAISPDFEPPTSSGLTPAYKDGDGGKNGGGDGDEDGSGRPDRERPELVFPQAVKSGLIAIDPSKSIYGAVKVIRDTPKMKGERHNGSEKYWLEYKRGAEIDVMVSGENVFGRTTKITYATTKTIGRMTKDDFKGVVPAFQLQMGVRELRQKLIDRLEEKRQFGHPKDAPIGMDQRVRLIKFKSYIDLYKEMNPGAKEVPEPAPAPERAPVVLKAEGKLEPLTRFPPRIVFLDVDSLKEPLSAVQLTDMAELQRTGVYFVAFSRRPYGAPDGMRDMLVKNMSSTQLLAQMPNRFLAVTDNGAVISKFRKDGAVVPVDSLPYSLTELDVLRDAAQKSYEKAGISRNDVVEQEQPQIYIDGRGFNPFRKEPKSEARDPRIRYELIFPRGGDAKQLAVWRASFERRLKDQGIAAVGTLTTLEDGRISYSVQKTKLMDSLDRLYHALGKSYRLYATPTKSDIVVLSEDPALRAINPRLDLSKLTNLKGPALFENVLGVILGEARKGGLKGSASRMISFSGYRERYMSDFIIAQDGAEQNINFFSGHMVHGVNDWLVSELQHGRVPTVEEYEAELRDDWTRGIRETKPVGIPKGRKMADLLNASVTRGKQMYKHVVAAHKRGEILIGTEIPNFIVIETFVRGKDGVLKKRYIVHTIFDFIALRPNKDKPGHADLVTYDFKTGPAKSVQKLEKDDQVLTYSLFNYEKWVGKPFPEPYMSGENTYVIDSASIEFIYNLVQKPTITHDDRRKQFARIPRVFDAIARTEAKLLGVTADGKPLPVKKAKAKTKAKAKGGKTAKKPVKPTAKKSKA